MHGFFDALRQPEYVHTLLNPLPVYGLAISWSALLLAIIVRSRAAQIVALTLTLICAVSAWPVYEFGEEAKDPVISMENETGQAWIEAHEQRAQRLIVFFYALAVISGGAILLPLKWPRFGLAAAITVLILAAAVLGMGAYIAYAGGKIRHHEFRNEAPPKTPQG